GNPFARQLAGFRKALANAVTPERFDRIADVLITKAEKGDLTATKLLFTYLLGKPAAQPDPDRLDLDDFRLLRERLSPLEEDWHLIRKMVPVEGIIEAGHRVADLRAETWREEVLGAAADRAQRQEAVKAAEEAAFQAREDAMLEEALTAIREVQSQPPEWKADMERRLTEAHESGCLNDVLQALRQETERTLAALNGTGSQTPPSANGGTVVCAPSTNGRTVVSPPSTNGAHGQPEPSANGVDGRHGPSANGPIGAGRGR